MAAVVDAERAERTRAWLADANEERGAVAIKCAGCGETVGYYRPGRVTAPSVRRPGVRVKCMRRGCRTETLVTLDEISA